MKYRPFGRTGLEISEIVFGAGNVGGLLIREDEETRRAGIRRAFDLGINWIDTAPSYGNGQSELSLGAILAEIGDEPYLSTKFRIDPGAGDIPGQIERSLSESLGRLRRDRVDLLQLHNRVTPEAGRNALGLDQILGKDGVADGLDRLKSQGVIGLSGFTALGDAASCQGVIASGRFDAAQVYHNVLNPSAGRAVPAAWSGYDFGNLIARAAEKGMGVLNIRVLAAGVIATDERTGREGGMVPGADVAADEARARAVFAALGDRYGSRAQTAIRFALGTAGISGVIVGFSTIAQIEEAAKAAALGPLPRAAEPALAAVYEADFTGTRQRTDG